VIIKDFVRNEDGKCTFSFEVEDDEAGVLMEFAIRTMIEAGLITIPGDENNPTDMFDFFADDDTKGTLQ
jgi:hypothetical protein